MKDKRLISIIAFSILVSGCGADQPKAKNLPVNVRENKELHDVTVCNVRFPTSAKSVASAKILEYQWELVTSDFKAEVINPPYVSFTIPGFEIALEGKRYLGLKIDYVKPTRRSARSIILVENQSFSYREAVVSEPITTAGLVNYRMMVFRDVQGTPGKCRWLAFKGLEPDRNGRKRLSANLFSLTPDTEGAFEIDAVEVLKRIQSSLQTYITN